MKTEVMSEDGTTITYEFKLEQAADVCRLLTSAGNLALKQQDHHIAMVLMAQAGMIKQGLHIRDIDAPDIMGDITAFHQKFGLEYSGKPRALEGELHNFRLNFMHEELDEYLEEQHGLIQSIKDNDHRKTALHLHQQLDALVDLVYVAVGTAYLQFGPDVFNEAWRRVQTANMAKERCEVPSDSKRGTTFDVIKPAGWEAPDHHDLVKDHAHIPYRHEGEVNPDYKSDTQMIA